jgi:hypothetical protein
LNPKLLSSVVIALIAGVSAGIAATPTVLKVHWALDGNINNGWFENMTYGRGDLSVFKTASNTNMAMGAHLKEHAVYTVGLKDTDGNRLVPEGVYRIKVDRIPPAQEGGFWSFTSYHGDFPLPLVANPIDRYAINDGYVSNLSDYDGTSFSFVYSAELPEGVEERDWLPASDSNPLPAFRIYNPGPEVLDGSYVMPSIERID